MTDISQILAFLPCPTPAEWIEEAIRPENLPDLLTDHANNEKKAAATALNLMFRYPDQPELLNKMSRLAREELRHFEQVLAIMAKRDIALRPLNAGRYAGMLRRGVRTHEPERQADTLIIGAFIEARSCERFAALAPYLDGELQKFYRSLLKSESRHFQDYLVLAQNIAGESLDERIAYLAALEQEAICSGDEEFRFHSGIPSF